MTNEQWLEVFKEIGSTMHAGIAEFLSAKAAQSRSARAREGTRPFRWTNGLRTSSSGA